MAKPTKKSPGIEKFITHTLGGTSRTDSINKDKCALCGKSAKKFKDAESEREYRISGMCQKCQDKVFDGSLNEAELKKGGSANLKAGEWKSEGQGMYGAKNKNGIYRRWSSRNTESNKQNAQQWAQDTTQPTERARRMKGPGVSYSIQDHIIREMIQEELHEAGLCNECILCRMKELGQTFGVQPSRQKELAKLISAKPTEREKLLTIARFGKDILGFRGDRLRQFAYAAKNVLLGGK